MAQWQSWSGLRSRRVRRRAFIVTGGMGVTAAFVAACGGDDKEQGSQQSGGAGGTQAAAGTSAAQTAVAEPKRGGMLKFATQNRPPNRDIHLSASALVQSSNIGPAYSRLIQFKVGPEIVGEQIPAPDLAEKWEQPDAKTLVFRLRPNAKFHPVAPVNGRAVTAQDVVYSFTRQAEQKVNAQYVADIDKMTAVDPQTLRIDLKAPEVDALVVLAAPWNKVIAREVVERFGDLKEAPVIGSGPFIVESVQAQVVDLKRNPDYFISGLPYVDSLRYTQIDDRNTTLAAFRTGEINTTTVNKQELDLLQRQNPKLDVRRSPSQTPYGLMVNTVEQPMSDPRVRRALNQAINRKALIDTVWFGEAALTTSISMNASLELPKEELEKIYAFDAKGSAALLKEAGVGNWTPKMTVWNEAQSQASGELIAPGLQDAGVKTTLELVDNARAVQTMQTGQGLVLHWGAWPNHASVSLDLRARWKTGGGWNGPKLSDPELDRLIDAQALELDAAKRKGMLVEIQRRILQNLSVIPGARPMAISVSQPQLKNSFWAPYLCYENVMQMWLDA